MTDLRERFAQLDDIETEDLWWEIEVRFDDGVERVSRPVERPRRRFAVAAAAAFVVALLLGAALLITQFQQEEPPIITQVPSPTSLPTPTSTVPETATTLPGLPNASLADLLEWSIVTLPGEVAVDCSDNELDPNCETDRGVVLRDVVVANGELVAVGHDGSTGNWEGAIFTSSDGETWDRVSAGENQLAGPGDQDIRALAVGDTAVVAVGSTDCAAHGINTPLRKCPAIWISEAGADWERIAIDAIRTEDGIRFTAALAEEPFAPDLSFEPDGYEIRSVTWTGEQFVAVGEASWTSPDGRSWIMHSLPSGETGECTPECQANSVLATGDFIIAVGKDPTRRASMQAGTASVWLSEDGLHWWQTQFDLPGNPELHSLAAIADGLVVVGNADYLQRERAGGVFYTRGEDKLNNNAGGASAIGIESVLEMSWSETKDLGSYFDVENSALVPRDVVIDGDRVIIVAFRGNSRWTTGGGAARIVASLDAGTTWEQYPIDDYSLFGAYASSTLGAAMNAATVFDDRLIVVGWFNTDAAVWTGIWTD